MKKSLQTVLFSVFTLTVFGQADLTAYAPSIITPTNLAWGVNINITLNIKNSGTTTSVPCHVSIRISSTTNWSDGIPLSKISLQSLSPNATTTFPFVYPIPYNVTPGTNYILYWIDPDNEEQNEINENNVFQSGTLVNVNPYALAVQKLPYPIIYVHGLASSNSTWDSLLNTFQNYYGWSYGGNLNFCLNKDNDVSTGNITYNYQDWTTGLTTADFYTVNFNVDNTNGSSYPDTWYYHNYSNQSAIVKQGYAIRDAIKHVLAITGRDKVILVGHSMGGLASREYLQRHTQSDGLIHVAKLVTVGTPHGGSNATFAGLGPLFNSVEESSEAVRDLRYSYFYSGNAGVYLFGGYESLAYMDDMLTQNFCNANVNCNGAINENISGLTQAWIPNDLSYSCIIGRGSALGGDAVVDYTRADINSYYPYSTLTISADTFTLWGSGIWHSELPNQVGGNVLGIDEPGYLGKSYTVALNNLYYGLIQRQTLGFPQITTDYDAYNVSVPTMGNLNIQVYDIPLKQFDINVYDASYNNIQPISSIGKNYINVNVPVNAGQNYVRLSGIPNNTSWLYPYAFKLSFSSTTDIQEFLTQIENVFNYPNPFNDKTNISFTLLQSDNISIKVYNSVGQLVSTLVEEKMEIGKHNIEFDGSDLSAGIYYYIIQSENIFISNKIVLEK